MRNDSASIICTLKIHENLRLGKVLMETQNKKKKLLMNYRTAGWIQYHKLIFLYIFFISLLLITRRKQTVIKTTHQTCGYSHFYISIYTQHFILFFFEKGGMKNMIMVTICFSVIKNRAKQFSGFEL
jgi:uncharacterized membrane protein